MQFKHVTLEFDGPVAVLKLDHQEVMNAVSIDMLGGLAEALDAIGKVSFAVDALETNFTAFMDQVVRARPAASKGVYIRNVAISSTMGPGVTIDTTPYRV